MRKYTMRDTQIAVYRPLTIGFVELLSIKLCIPIQGNALKASKKPSVLPYGVSFKNSRMTAGEEIMVTQIYKDVTIEAMAQVKKIYIIPIILLRIVREGSSRTEQWTRTVVPLIQMSVELIILASYLLSARLIIQFVIREDMPQSSYRIKDLLLSTIVQLSNFNNDLDYFYILNRVYNPVSKTCYSYNTYVILRFLYIEQCSVLSLGFYGVLLFITLSRLSIFYRQISPIQSSLRAKLFSVKHFSRECALSLMTSSPTANILKQDMPRTKEIMKIAVQHKSAFYDLFDLSAMRNRCFYTSI